ncbi:keratin, type I cytoskeletal 19-like [Oxyura jamaicensis]|uniref:keratin, type I cytoskeletal 19-like n=1 Tax=Oxyura jamaicensis TaxID=8884 RepID=UPI0015A5646C|nr:keratin, type I cytoskeletal 19-like [Oxyura jamaicensis]
MSCAVRQVVTACSQGRSSAGSSAAGAGRKVSSASSGRHAACDFAGAAGNFSGGSSSEGLLGKALSAGSAAGGSFGAAPRACSTIGFGGGGMCARGVAGGFARAGGGCGEGILFANNEKATMQNLNDRLASYLDKVRLLEGENADLECKIREWYAKVGPSCEPRDYSCFHKEIEDLQNQILCAAMETNKILLNIDNNRMTADDFRVKYETECGLRQNVDADICNLRPVLDQLASCKTDLQLQCEALTEEMCCLKTNHEEEMNCLRKQATGDVSVEVNACPGPDLRKILEDLRCQYETLMERNRKETEQWYACKVEEVNLEVVTSSQEIESSNKQVTELRRQLQALEINVQAQLTMKENLESSLAETECRYNKYLAELQSQISCVEQRLAEIRAEMECQNQEYKTLLDVKCRLEQEIQTYHCLLEGGQHDIIGPAGRGVPGVPQAARSGGLKASLCQPCLS